MKLIGLILAVLICLAFAASFVAPFFWPRRGDEMQQPHGDVPVPVKGRVNNG